MMVVFAFFWHSIAANYRFVGTVARYIYVIIKRFQGNPSL